jgi:hypothetical protein
MDFAAGVYLSEAQNPITPPHTLNMYVYTVYCRVLINTGRGRRRGWGDILEKIYL